MKKRLLALLLALILALGLLPAAALATDPAEIRVNLTAQAAGAFLCAPQFGVSVSGDLAERYGYADAVSDGVSALDVLVRAHELVFDTAFTGETAKTLLTLNDSGYLTTVFGVETGAFSFAVNGEAPVDKNTIWPAGGGYPESYGGLSVVQAAVGDGDSVAFFLYQDTATYLDYYTWFETADGPADSLTAKVGEPLALTLKGYFFAAYSMTTDASLRDGSALIDSGACEDLPVVLIDANTGAVTNAELTTVDENGAFSVSFDAPGTYLLSAQGDKYTDVVSPLCAITVEGPTVSLRVTSGSGASVPKSGYTYDIGDTAETLKVTAQADTDPTGTGSYTYQWRTKTAVDATSSSTAAGTRTNATYTPATAKDSLLYYYCKVSYVYLGETYSAESALVPVMVTATVATQPVITTQPKPGGPYLVGAPDAPALSVAAKAVTDGGVLSYQWYAKIDGGDFAAVTGATAKTLVPASERSCTIQYYCEVTNTITSVDGEHTYTAAAQSDPAAVTFQSAAEYGAGWEGDGTAATPYLIQTQADLAKLAELCNTSGVSFAGKQFRMTTDLTLPDDWTPLGTNPKTNPFSGHFDGGGFTLTIPAGGKTLIGAPVEATLANLNLYGTQIAGNGVVDIYTTGVKGKTAITIESVTLKSGSQTLKSGFVGGYAPGDYPVVIRNCTVEAGVLIGYDGQQSNIGSFGGDFNGTIEGCVSAATVRGVNHVGGIAGSKGQSMGDYLLRDCIFTGSVEATGNYVGGISGCGYGGTQWGFSANAGWPTIQNCLVSGRVSGANYVGGILGAEPGVTQCWINGTGYVQNNCFTGTVAATADSAYVGGVIGYLKSVDRVTVIENNYYLSGCGADQGLGGLAAVDASAQYGRSDVTAGSDPALFSQAVAQQDAALVQALNAGMNSSGDWVLTGGALGFGGRRHLVSLRTDPVLATAAGLTVNTGAELTDSTHRLVLTYSDGTSETAALSQATRVNCDFTVTGTRVAGLVYNNHQYLFLLKVPAAITPEDPAPAGELTVSVTVLGDGVHGEGGTVHTLKDGGLQTWIAATTVSVPAGANVMTALSKLLNQQGYSWLNDDEAGSVTGNYIQAVTTPSGLTLAEFSNGSRSGWLYTLNGATPLLGVRDQYLSDGDVIVLHYTDDYAKERGAENWTPTDTETNDPLAAFADLTGHWAREEIRWAAEQGLFTGMSETVFAPELGTTCAMIAALLYRLAGEPDATGLAQPFTDVPANAYYLDALRWGAAAGILTGDGGSEFRPNRNVSRQELAALLCRFAVWQKRDVTAAAALDGFADAEQVAAWAQAALRWAAAVKLVQGYEDNTLRPTGGATRAETAVLLKRFSDLYA